MLGEDKSSDGKERSQRKNQSPHQERVYRQSPLLSLIAITFMGARYNLARSMGNHRYQSLAIETIGTMCYTQYTPMTHMIRKQSHQAGTTPHG